MRKADADLVLDIAQGMLARGVSPDTVARAVGADLTQVERLATGMAWDSFCGTGEDRHARHGVSASVTLQLPRTRAVAERIAAHASRMQKAKPQTEAELQAAIAAYSGRVRIMPTADVREGAENQRPRAGRR